VVGSVDLPATIDAAQADVTVNSLTEAVAFWAKQRLLGGRSTSLESFEALPFKGAETEEIRRYFVLGYPHERISFFRHAATSRQRRWDKIGRKHYGSESAAYSCSLCQSSHSQLRREAA
jgi:hypothetical protein